MPSSIPRRGPVLAALTLLFVIGFALGAAAQSRPAAGLTGAELFEAGCAGCHGPEGAGAADSTVGFEKPSTYPDFTGCDQTSPETEAGWYAVIHDGGKARGFSRIMPAFGELLTPEQITSLVKYIRGLCKDPAWPPGELNLPRPLNTEKAFPESEWVYAASIDKKTRDAVNTLLYERRIGAKNQVEIAVPFAVAHDQVDVHHGIGDIELGYKRVLFSSQRTGSIVSAQGVVTLPSGNMDTGLGAGTTVFEAFAAVGQIFRAESFVQGQVGIEQPADTEIAPRAVFTRWAIGKSFRADRGLGRMWTPMLELLADRDLESGASANIDLVPQIQVTLNRRQHVRAAVGVQVPLTNRIDRAAQVGFYLLWDWFDGGFLAGWK
ncbi:MAG TPA: cytochrome c [Vicinamibacterales bacterium]|nr:cytochrome c [Vicinamibacterales bacterium]